MEEAPPKPFEHCCTIFEQMKKASKPTQIDGKHALVYEGHLTRLFAELQLATPYYTKIMRLLKDMECVRQLSRGGGPAPSRWELLKEPDWDDFERIETSRLRTNTKLGQTIDNTNALARRLDAVELRVAALEENKEAS